MMYEKKNKDAGEEYVSPRDRRREPVVAIPYKDDAVANYLVSHVWRPITVRGNVHLGLNEAKQLIGPDAVTTRYGYAGTGPDGEEVRIYRLKSRVGKESRMSFVADGKVNTHRDFPSGGAASYGTYGEVLTQHLLTDPAYKGSCVETLHSWINHPRGPVSLANVVSKPVNPDASYESYRGLYLRLFGRSVVLDIVNHNCSQRKIEGYISLFIQAVDAAGARGYMADDAIYVQEVNEMSKTLIELLDVDIDAPIFPTYRQEGGKTLEINEEVAHESIEYATSHYRSDEEFVTAYLALNFDKIRRSLFGVRTEQSMPTTYPGVKLPLTAALNDRFAPLNGKSLAYVEAFELKTGIGKFKIYAFDLETAKKDVRVFLNEQEFIQMRKEVYPTLDVNGYKARYIGAERENEKVTGYNYLMVTGVDAGKVIKVDAEAHAEIVVSNPDATSFNIRRGITNVDKFFKYMPKHLADSLPAGEALAELMQYVEDRINKSVIPVTVSLSKGKKNAVQVQEEVSKFMKKLLEPIANGGIGFIKEDGTLDAERLNKRHPRTAKNLESAVERTKGAIDKIFGSMDSEAAKMLNRHIVTSYIEEMVCGPLGALPANLHGLQKPNEAYYTWRDENKYDSWMRKLAAARGFDMNNVTDVGNFNRVWDGVKEDANVWIQSKGLSSIIPAAQKVRLAENFTREDYLKMVTEKPRKEITALVELMVQQVAGRGVRMKSPEEAAYYVDPSSIELLSGVAANRYIVNLSANAKYRGGSLPYILPEKTLERSERMMELRVDITRGNLVHPEEWKRLSDNVKSRIEKHANEKAAEVREDSNLSASHKVLLKGMTAAFESNDLVRLGAIVGVAYELAGKKLKNEEVYGAYVDTDKRVIVEVKKLMDEKTAKSLVVAYEEYVKRYGKGSPTR